MFTLKQVLRIRFTDRSGFWSFGSYDQYTMIPRLQGNTTHVKPLKSVFKEYKCTISAYSTITILPIKIKGNVTSLSCGM